LAKNNEYYEKLDDLIFTTVLYICGCVKTKERKSNKYFFDSAMI